MPTRDSSAVWVGKVCVDPTKLLDGLLESIPRLSVGLTNTSHHYFSEESDCKVKNVYPFGPRSSMFCSRVLGIWDERFDPNCVRVD